jgi:virulence factor Mce-like protein
LPALRLSRPAAIAAVVIVVAATALWWIFFGANTRRISAVFDSVIGVDAGSQVRILGVEVGSVDDVVPLGTRVRVDMSVDRSVPIPAGADAVIVAPSVVSDRYVQLTPAYSGGPTLPDGAVITRTATPVELDQLFASLNKLTTALGPGGANSAGAFSDLLATLANNLHGNGQALHDTITRLADVAKTLSDNKDQLFATVDGLASFTGALAASDNQVRSFVDLISQVSGYLAGERGTLAQAVAELDTTLTAVQNFIQDNRSALKSNVDNLAAVTKILVDERSALAQAVDVAPLATVDAVNAYNAASGTLDFRPDVNELAQPPILEVCKLLGQVGGGQVPAAVASACGQLSPIVQGLVPLPSTAQVLGALRSGQLPPLPLPLSGVVYGAPAR